MYKNAGYIEHIPHIFICAGWRNGGCDSCEVSCFGDFIEMKKVAVPFQVFIEIFEIESSN
ncbi:hypothetical protein ALC57_14855 [Trachymyrmex cornetzi]|uniref:Uncharacterized protein n=1 Tax=Trachymyrmex cornetzi TaxID=471704 RepID=A0A151IXS1_9HYME|nr:hypothetical protein ALC57_14855 [Trachymyrmex cornetzi]